MRNKNLAEKKVHCFQLFISFDLHSSMLFLNKFVSTSYISSNAEVEEKVERETLAVWRKTESLISFDQEKLLCLICHLAVRMRAL